MWCLYPGILITTWDLLKIMPDPEAAAVQVAISGDLCRCTGYQWIVRSILRAARELRTCHLQREAP
jgi:aerobic carbon-monoxide dehydrogenase small subunit